MAVDVARGLALLGMFAVHSLWNVNEDGSPTLTTMVASGRSAGTFAVLAGVSLALMTGGRRPVEGRARKIASCGLLARALAIGAIGLLLGYVINWLELGLAGILAFYAAAFLLAIPLLWLARRTLVILAVIIAVVAPVAIFLLWDHVPEPVNADPTFTYALGSPLDFLSLLFVTGPYPVLALVALVISGVAIGRFDLMSKRVARLMLACGSGLAVAAWGGASVLLFQFGGLEALFSEVPQDQDNIVTRDTVLWWPVVGVDSWWVLASRAPHSYSTFDTVHSIGVATALVGALILATRRAVIRRFLRPLAAAGSMPLTIYTAHVFMLALWVFEVNPVAYYVVMVAMSLAFAVVWQRVRGQGPLELMVASIARGARSVAQARLR